MDLVLTELVRFGHLGLGPEDLVLDAQLLQYLRYEKKNRIHVHHDVIYRFAMRLKAIRDKACPVGFFPKLSTELSGFFYVFVCQKQPFTKKILKQFLYTYVRLVVSARYSKNGQNERKQKSLCTRAHRHTIGLHHGVVRYPILVVVTSLILWH